MTEIRWSFEEPPILYCASEFMGSSINFTIVDYPTDAPLQSFTVQAS
jgi:hypothetical protein